MEGDRARLGGGKEMDGMKKERKRRPVEGREREGGGEGEGMRSRIWIPTIDESYIHADYPVCMKSHIYVSEKNLFGVIHPNFEENHVFITF